MKEKTLKYLAKRPAATQSLDHIDNFLTQFGELKKKMGFELTPQEVLHLINHRPTSTVDLHVLVEDYSERLTPEQVEALLSLVAECLPPAPAADEYYEEVEQGEEEVQKGDEEEEEIADDTDIARDQERLQRVAASALQTYLASEETELNRDARAQADAENEGRDGADDDAVPAGTDLAMEAFDMPLPVDDEMEIIEHVEKEEVTVTATTTTTTGKKGRGKR